MLRITRLLNPTWLIRTGGGLIPDDPLSQLVAALYGAGEQGVLWVPSLDTCWKDTAGTIPCTAAGDLVARIDDLSGNGNHITQGATASRPLLQQTDGHWHLVFDGVDDSLVTTSAVIAADKNVSMCASVAIDDAYGSARQLCGLGSSNISHQLGLCQLSGGLWYVYTDGVNVNHNAFFPEDNYPGTAPQVVTHFVEVGAKLRLRRNGAALTTSLAQNSTMAARTGADGFRVGRRSDGTMAFFSGAVYGLCLTEKLLSGALLQQTEKFMADLAGVTLP